MSKVTIEDISRHTGLSRGTVSRALNDRPDISQQTKQRVLEACRQLNYVPSHAARSLATGRSFAVAVLVDDLSSGFAARFLRGVIDEAQTQQYAVYVTELGQSAHAVSTQLAQLARERVDGLLLATPLSGEILQSLGESLQRCVVVASTAQSGVAGDVLAPDYREAGRLATRAAFRAASDVSYVTDERVSGAALRLEGFRDICRERQIDPAAHIVDVHDPRLDDVLRSAAAIVGADDFVAIRALSRAALLGRRAGRDIAIIGQGNEFAAEHVDPALTTVDLCGADVGRRAMALALARIGKLRQDAPETTYVAPLLIERSSGGRA